MEALFAAVAEEEEAGAADEEGEGADGDEEGDIEDFASLFDVVVELEPPPDPERILKTT